MKDSKLREFDDLTRANHSRLGAADHCFYFMEYTPQQGFDYSEGNQFILNLKKSPLRRGTWEYSHKTRAINEAAKSLRQELPTGWLENSTFVPIPPSKSRDDPEYDDRITRILKKIGRIDVREVVVQRKSMEAAHRMGDNRHSLQEIIDNYEIAEDKSEPEPTHIVILDDVVTAGTHFRAMESVLVERFPDVAISGVFLARRVVLTDADQK